MKIQLQTKKYVLYLVLWGFVATILLISNTISLALSGTSGKIWGTVLYHFTASTLWIAVAMLLAWYYSAGDRNSFKWLFISFSFFPLVEVVDTLFRSLIRYIFIDIPFTADNLSVVFFTLVDANFLIYGCLSLFLFYSVNTVGQEARSLKEAEEEMGSSRLELDRYASVLPPEFLSRNIGRIIQTYESSYEMGEEMIVLFSDFLRLVIYREDREEFIESTGNGVKILIDSYEKYISTYVNSEVTTSITDIDELFEFDCKLDGGVHENKMA